MTLFEILIGAVIVLGKIIGFVIFVGLMLLLYIIFKEIAWVIHEDNVRKMEEKHKHEDDSI